MRTTISASFTIPGWHMWPDAPEEVRYLRVLHRHDFRVTVEVYVGHDDREVELHLLALAAQARLRLLYAPAEYKVDGLLFHTDSCERIARVLGRVLIEEEDLLVRSVSVFEDENFGAKAVFDFQMVSS